MDFQKRSALNPALCAVLLCKQHQGGGESPLLLNFSDSGMYQKIHISQSLGNNVITAKHNCLKLSYMCNEISHTIGYWGITLTSLIQLCKVRNVSKS